MAMKLTKRTPREAGANYLKGSKVASAAGYVTVAGTILGVPHGPRSRSSPRVPFDTVSEYQHRFKELPYSYVSMDYKPLEPYNPNSLRSRLAVDDPPVPVQNRSSIHFDHGMHTCEQKRFLTTNNIHHTGASCDPRSNQAMISHDTKFLRTQQAK
mmetsp:Transcript_5423/g.16116  ORF Transcript_5423/g.16116 Transcript_5423/m.16116 type:complete len:155 (+) Transcript_5423:75-539(+)